MRCTPFLTLVALAGCTQDPTSYPSLLPRAAETQSLEEPVRPEAVATADAALDARLAAIRATLAANGQKFSSAAQEAEAKVAVARGLREGSEGWLDAHSALSIVESLRAPTLAALSDLEEIAIARGQAGEPPYPALDALAREAEAAVAAQNQRIATLDAALGGS